MAANTSLAAFCRLAGIRLYIAVDSTSKMGFSNIFYGWYVARQLNSPLHEVGQCAEKQRQTSHGNRKNIVIF